MSVEVRRKAAENAFQRARDAGHAVEQDDRFHAWIEEWIAGHIDMPEVARRYRSLVRERSAAHRVSAAGVITAAEHIRNTDEPATAQPLYLETEINRLMDEGGRTAET